MQNALPKDFKKYVITGICCRLLICFAALTAFIVLAAIYGDEFLFRTEQLSNNKVFVYILICGLICFVCGVPKRFFDSTFTGTVEKVSVVSGYDSEARGQRQSPINSRTVSHRAFKAVNTVFITVRTSKNKLLTRKVYCEGSGNGTNYDDLFKAGDKVFHLFGTKHYVNLSKSNTQKITCPVCGSQNPIENSSCGYCGHSLIKP